VAFGASAALEELELLEEESLEEEVSFSATFLSFEALDELDEELLDELEEEELDAADEELLEEESLDEELLSSEELDEELLALASTFCFLELGPAGASSSPSLSRGRLVERKVL